MGCAQQPRMPIVVDLAFHDGHCTLNPKVPCTLEFHVKVSRCGHTVVLFFSHRAYISQIEQVINSEVCHTDLSFEKKQTRSNRLTITKKPTRKAGLTLRWRTQKQRSPSQTELFCPAICCASPQEVKCIKRAAVSGKREIHLWPPRVRCIAYVRITNNIERHMGPIGKQNQSIIFTLDQSSYKSSLVLSVASPRTTREELRHQRTKESLMHQ